ncbi:hypothetical protein Tco_0364522 [Tanacetum coccineum]
MTNQSLRHASCFRLRRGVTDWTGGQDGRGGGRSGEQAGIVGGRTGDQVARRWQGIQRMEAVDEVRNFSTVSRSHAVARHTLYTIAAQEDFRNANLVNGRNGCSYKEFVACKPKEFDEGQVHYLAGSLTVEHCHGGNSAKQSSGVTLWLEAYTNRFHELARLVPHLATLKTKRIERYIYGLAPQIRGMVAETKPPMIQNAILKARVLIDEAVRNGSLQRTGERKGDGGESSKEGNVKGDNKRAGTGKVFATITNPVRREYTGSAPKCINCYFHHHPEMPCCACTNYSRLGYFAKDFRAGPKMVNPLNSKNPIVARAACYECGGTDHYKAACPRAFLIGAEEARQDLNIVMGMFSLNNHYATMLFNSGADYSFVSTTFMPLLDIEPSSLAFSYEIEIASGQLVEINKGIRRTAKIEGLPPSREAEFRIDLIPGAMLVVKSPCRLAPTEMEELSNQLKELQDKGFIQPSSSP